MNKHESYEIILVESTKFLHKKINKKLSTFTTIFEWTFFSFAKQWNEFLHDKIHFPSILTSGTQSTSPQNLIKFHHRSQTKNFYLFSSRQRLYLCCGFCKISFASVVFLRQVRKKKQNQTSPSLFFNFPRSPNDFHIVITIITIYHKKSETFFFTSVRVCQLEVNIGLPNAFCHEIQAL